MRWSAVITATLIGCSAEPSVLAPLTDDVDVVDTQEPPEDAVDEPVADACQATVSWIRPEDGERFAEVDAPVTVGFSDALPSSQTDLTVTLVGVEGRVDVSPDGRSAEFWPSEPLAYRTDYVAQVSLCGEVTERTFRTTPPPIEPSLLVDRGWNFNLGDLHWHAPAAAELFTPLLGVANVLTSVRTDYLGQPHLHARFGLGPTQPMPCAPVIDLGVIALRDNPLFELGPAPMQVRWQGEDLGMEGLELHGVFEEDGTTIEEFSFSGLFDVRPVEALTGLDDLCGVSEAYGEACEACPDGQVACLRAFASLDVAEAANADIWSDLLADLGLCDL